MCRCYANVRLVILGLFALACSAGSSAIAEHNLSPGLHDIVVYDAGAHAQGLPGINFREAGDGLKVDIPPAVHVHRYYYSGDKEIQGPIVAGGPTIVVAKHPKTGQQIREFGQQGKTDLNYSASERGRYRWTGAPQVCRDVVIVGSSMADSYERREDRPGDVRAYDVRSGRLRWTFHVVPARGELGTETWSEQPGRLRCPRRSPSRCNASGPRASRGRGSRVAK